MQSQDADASKVLATNSKSTARRLNTSSNFGQLALCGQMYKVRPIECDG